MMTNQMTNGNQSFASNYIQECDTLLNNLDTKIGLPDINIFSSQSDELKTYLTMPITQLERLDSVQCGEISYRLSQYAFYIQKVTNRYKVYIKSLNFKINNIISPNISNYKSLSWEMAKAAAIRNDSAAYELSKKLNLCEQGLDSLDGMATKLKELSETLRSLQYAKSAEMKS